MADKSFGIKELNLIGASGTPTITSPNNLNLNASNVAISTDVTIGRHLDVDGHAEFDAVNVSGVSTFSGITTVPGPSLFTNQLSVSGISTFLGAINVNDSYGTSGEVLTSQGSGSAPQWASASNDQIYRIDQTSLSGTTGATLTGIDSDALWISVVFSSISTSANSGAVIQLTNSSGTATTSGYDSRGNYLNTGTGTYTNTSGFCLHNPDASITIKGYWNLFRQASGIWCGGGSGKTGTSTYVWAGNMGGGPTIGGIRISVPSGTFDDGSFAVFWGA